MKRRGIRGGSRVVVELSDRKKPTAAAKIRCSPTVTTTAGCSLRNCTGGDEE
jgi:hypothetical protein